MSNAKQYITVRSSLPLNFFGDGAAIKETHGIAIRDEKLFVMPGRVVTLQLTGHVQQALAEGRIQIVTDAELVTDAESRTAGDTTTPQETLDQLIRTQIAKQA